jgi:hypothetical protein
MTADNFPPPAPSFNWPVSKVRWTNGLARVETFGPTADYSRGAGDWLSNGGREPDLATTDCESHAKQSLAPCLEMDDAAEEDVVH